MSCQTQQSRIPTRILSNVDQVGFLVRIRLGRVRILDLVGILLCWIWRDIYLPTVSNMIMTGGGREIWVRNLSTKNTAVAFESKLYARGSGDGLGETPLISRDPQNEGGYFLEGGGGLTHIP